MPRQPSTAAPASHFDLLFVGSVYCDLVFSGVPMPEPGAEVYADDFTLTPGGTANRAVAASRLGARTALMSQLGDDALGVRVAAILSVEPDLDLTWLTQIAGFQSPVTVALTGQHERSFITYQEPLAPFEWPAGRPTVGATHINVASAIPEWATRLRAAGTILVGGVGFDQSGLWSRDVLDRLAGIDVFVPNDLEAMRYTKTDTPQAAAKALGEFVDLAIVTCGSRGVVAYSRSLDELVEVPTVEVKAMDPTGAGDVFVASFMVSDRFDWPLRERLRFAGLSAALSVRSLGGAASAPRPSDIAAFLAAETPDGDWSTIRSWALHHGVTKKH